MANARKSVDLFPTVAKATTSTAATQNAASPAASNAAVTQPATQTAKQPAKQTATRAAAQPAKQNATQSAAASVASAAAIAVQAESLPFGPWKTLYSGVWAGHKTNVFVNGERVLLLLVHDDAHSNAALLLMKRVFIVDGESRELVEFLNSQKRSFTVIEKIGRAGRYKFLVLEGQPTYVANLSRDFADVLKSQYFFLSGVGKALKDVASSYRVKIEGLEKAVFEVADTLLGDPLLLTESKPAEGKGALQESRGTREARETNVASRQRAPRYAFIGLSSGRESFQVNFEALRRVTVTSKDAAFAAKIQQLLGEAALLNNVSILVFSSTNALHGLADPALERKDFDYFGMQGDPHGFPFKEFSLTTLRIDLASLAADDFVSALGLSNADFADAIAAAFDAAFDESKTSKTHDIVELMEALDKIDAALFPPMVRARALRVLRCLEKEFPHSFGENKPALFEDALRAAHEKTLASVLWVDCAGVPETLKQLYYCFISSAAMKAFESKEGEVDFLAFVDEDASLLGEAARRALSRASEAGAGCCLRAEYGADLNSFHSTLAFELAGADAFAVANGAKTKFLPRPTYSRNAAKLNGATPAFMGARIAQVNAGQSSATQSGAATQATQVKPTQPGSVQAKPAEQNEQKEQKPSAAAAPAPPKPKKRFF